MPGADERVAWPRALPTARARRWAIERIGREHASIHGLARQLCTTWDTVWASIRRLLEDAAADESRFEGSPLWAWMSTCGITCRRSGAGPKELTEMVDLTRQPDPKDPAKLVVNARLMDLVVGLLRARVRGHHKQQFTVEWSADRDGPPEVGRSPPHRESSRLASSSCRTCEVVAVVRLPDEGTHLPDSR